MEYLTLRLQQKTDGTTFHSLSEFKETEQDANVLYWQMRQNDIADEEVSEFTDCVLDELGNVTNYRQYTREGAEEMTKFYYVKIEKFTAESEKSPVRKTAEYDDKDSAEIAFCKDNASAEKNTDILTAAHFVVNHHGGKEFYQLYDNRPLPEPEDVTEE